MEIGAKISPAPLFRQIFSVSVYNTTEHPLKKRAPTQN